MPTELLGTEELLGTKELLDDGVVGVDGGVGGGTGAGVEIPKIGRHAAILNPPQRDCNTLRIRPCSLRSIDKPHRALIEIQLPRYVQT